LTIVYILFTFTYYYYISETLCAISSNRREKNVVMWYSRIEREREKKMNITRKVLIIIIDLTVLIFNWSYQFSFVSFLLPIIYVHFLRYYFLDGGGGEMFLMYCNYAYNNNFFWKKINIYIMIIILLLLWIQKKHFPEINREGREGESEIQNCLIRIFKKHKQE